MTIYIHYLITYIPIAGSLLGGFILSNQLLLNKKIDPKPIYLVFIFSSICSIYTFSIIKFYDHFSSNVDLLFRTILEEKILFVNLSVISLILLGISSLIGLFIINRNYQTEISLAIVISIIALFSSIFSIRSEYIKSNWYFYSKQVGNSNKN